MDTKSRVSGEGQERQSAESDADDCAGSKPPRGEVRGSGAEAAGRRRAVQAKDDKGAD